MPTGDLVDGGARDRGSRGCPASDLRRRAGGGSRRLRPGRSGREEAFGRADTPGFGTATALRGRVRSTLRRARLEEVSFPDASTPSDAGPPVVQPSIVARRDGR